MDIAWTRQIKVTFSSAGLKHKPVITLTAGPDYIQVFHFVISTLNTSFSRYHRQNVTPINNISKSLTSIVSNLNNFHSLEVVNRVSETQLQVSENSN